MAKSALKKAAHANRKVEASIAHLIG